MALGTPSIVEIDEHLCEKTVGAVSGATAGVVVEAALYPIDTIKTRLQVCMISTILYLHCPGLSFPNPSYNLAQQNLCWL